ncbi:MAG: substrate-binding domain-containing protein [Lachnospiraceae bacterium]
MEERIYTPLEAAEMLRVKKNTIYEMIKKGTLTATKMGKQFRIRESDLNRLLTPGSAGSSAVGPDVGTSPLDHPASSTIIVCGQDIVLDLLCSNVNSRLGSASFVRSYQGSYNGLHAMYKNEVTVASAHLWDQETDTYNTPFIKHLLPGEQIHLFHILSRPVGLYVQKGNPKQISKVSDFEREDVTIVNREKGSGIRILMDSLLQMEQIDARGIRGYGREVSSHLAAAALVAKTGADCAMGIKNVAQQFQNVDFVFLKNEEYDLAVRESDLDRPAIRLMIETLQSRSFQDEIDAMGLYDIKEMGKRLL